MISRKDHVWDFEGDIVEPLLPKIPICLVDHRDVTAKRTTLVGVFTRGEGRVVALGVVAGRE